MNRKACLQLLISLGLGALAVLVAQCLGVPQIELLEWAREIFPGLDYDDLLGPPINTH